MSGNDAIKELLLKEHQLEVKLSNLIYGAPEVRDGKLYVHFRDSGRQMTRYVGTYTDEAYNLILRNNQLARSIKNDLKHTRHELNRLGYIRHTLSDKVKRNLDFARHNLALTIHSQAILEGVATTFADTEAIIEGGRVNGMTEKDIRKIVNMKHAWEFITDDDIITAKDDLALLCQINKLIEEGFYFSAGKLRDVPVNIGGTSWRPELPLESKISEDLDAILSSSHTNIDKSILLALFVMKSQIFLDGNKRTAIIFANHFLIKHGLGLLYVPESKTDEFKRLLISFYETNQKSQLASFLKTHCLIRI